MKQTMAGYVHVYTLSVRQARYLTDNIVTVKQFLLIHQYLDLDSLNLTQWTKIASKLEYCNSLLYNGLPQSP